MELEAFLGAIVTPLLIAVWLIIVVYAGRIVGWVITVISTLVAKPDAQTAANRYLSAQQNYDESCARAETRYHAWWEKDGCLFVEQHLLSTQGTQSQKYVNDEELFLAEIRLLKLQIERYVVIQMTKNERENLIKVMDDTIRHEESYTRLRELLKERDTTMPKIRSELQDSGINVELLDTIFSPN